MNDQPVPNVTCPSCSTVNGPGAKFCNGCGANLESGAGATAGPSAPSAPAIPAAPAAQASPSYCRACGKQIDPRASMCPHCGVAQNRGLAGLVDSGAKKEPWIAVLLAFLWSGLGHIYVGGDNMGKGIALAVAYGVTWLLMSTLLVILIGIVLIPVVFGIWIYAMIDANTVANEHNRRLGLQ